VNQEQATAIFRIFQEALTNVLRHARATRIDIHLAMRDGEYRLMISDNGRGISDGEKLGQFSLGLLGMRERAHLIGGEVEVSGVERLGTTVTVRVPLSAPALP
jgi:signal transduction histidine kinase